MLPAWVQSVCAKIPTWEGNVSWLYLDNAKLPNATTGQGYLVASKQESLLLPWLNTDGSAATPDEIVWDWVRVTSMPGGKVAAFYKSPNGLSLSQDAINSLTSTTVESFSGPLHALLPAFDSFPLSAQTAIGDMCYSFSVNGLKAKYPLFCAAVQSRDWKAAAAECGRNVSEASFALRNAWTAGLLLQAVTA